MSVWYNCYNEGWKGVIVEDAFQHPAKFSRALIRRIYEHALERGWLQAGARVIDPFGGVALGALDALRYGLHWTGVELEPRFVEMGQRNIALWNETYSQAFPRWGTAQLLQGDSRELAGLLGGGEGLVSSPPYAGYDEHGGRATAAERDRRRLERIAPERIGRFDTCFRGSEEYGVTPGQLGAMKAGGFEAAVSSPPYADITNVGERRDPQKAIDAETRYRAAHPELEGIRPQPITPYGITPGNLGSMKAGDFEAAVSSPPYESTRVVDGATQNGDINTIPEHIDTYGAGSTRRKKDSIDDFWQASRAIVEQVYQVLAPGAVSIWVCKDFVRNKARVPFSSQWGQLCEAVGFELVELHQASLVIDNGTQLGMFGTDVDLVKERKSFFRCLAEKKGSPRIDHEDVLCLRKPFETYGLR